MSVKKSNLTMKPSPMANEQRLGLPVWYMLCYMNIL